LKELGRKNLNRILARSSHKATQRQAAWLGLAASGGFWLLASGFYLAGRRQKF
jgi:hypothetical protein